MNKFLLAAFFLASPVAMSIAGIATAQTRADILVEEFYKWYPCMVPETGYKMARDFPALAIAILNSSRPERDRYAAYMLFVGAQAPGYKGVIRHALSDPSEQIRRSAIHHLPLAMAKEELIQTYIHMLDDPTDFVRYYGAEGLARHPSKDAVESLLKLLADKSNETRHCAVFALLSWKDDEVRVRLRELADTDNIVIAGVVTFALAQYPDEQIKISVLNSYLLYELQSSKESSYSPGIVINMIRLVAKRGDDTSLAALEVAEKHEHLHIKDAARRAMAEMKGENDPARGAMAEMKTQEDLLRDAARRALAELKAQKEP
jgi:HEAT repeat protein